MKSWIIKICLCLSLCELFFTNCVSNHNAHANKSSNSIVNFFDHSDIQAETIEQRRSISVVLNDMLRLKADQLRAKKYPDYANIPEQWDVITFLNSYFVPSTSINLSHDLFFKDLEKPRTRAIIKEQLSKIELALQTSPASTSQQNKILK